MRRMLKPGGIALWRTRRRPRCSPRRATSRADFYGFSIFTCLPAAMTEPRTAATGTVIREDTVRRYASEAGFTRSSASTTRRSDMLASTSFSG